MYQRMLPVRPAESEIDLTVYLSKSEHALAATLFIRFLKRMISWKPIFAAARAQDPDYGQPKKVEPLPSGKSKVTITMCADMTTADFQDFFKRFDYLASNLRELHRVRPCNDAQLTYLTELVGCGLRMTETNDKMERELEAGRTGLLLEVWEKIMGDEEDFDVKSAVEDLDVNMEWE